MLSVMAVLDLSGCFSKIEQVEEHLQAIQVESKRWHDTHPYRFARQTSADLTRHSVIARFTLITRIKVVNSVIQVSPLLHETASLISRAACSGIKRISPSLLAQALFSLAGL